MNKEQEYLHRLEDILKRHIKEIEKDIRCWPEDYEKEFCRGQIDAFRFILKNMGIAGVRK